MDADPFRLLNPGNVLSGYLSRRSTATTTPKSTWKIVVLSQNSEARAPLIVFLHVQKTAGTSFKHWLAQSFSTRAIFHKDSKVSEKIVDGGSIENRGFAANGALVCDVHEHFKLNGANGFDRFDVVAGHICFDFSLIDKIERPIIICSAVRNPIERVISLYNWARVNNQNPMHRCVTGRSLLESLKSGGKFYDRCRNMQIRCVFGRRRNLFSYKRKNNKWTMICKYDRYDIIIKKIISIYNLPSGEFPRRNLMHQQHKQEVYLQPDFDDAVNYIRRMNAEEIAFFDLVGDFAEFNKPKHIMLI